MVFLLTREAPCPYLPGRRERKLVTELSGPDAPENFDLLSRAGFRRSHAVAYRPACHGCQACVPVRVPVAEFRPGRSLRRVARRTAGLAWSLRPARATAEQFALFSRYLMRRHGDGEMAGMAFADYRAMIEDTPIDTGVFELRDGDESLVVGGPVPFEGQGRPTKVTTSHFPVRHCRLVSWPGAGTGAAHIDRQGV